MWVNSLFLQSCLWLWYGQLLEFLLFSEKMEMTWNSVMWPTAWVPVLTSQKWWAITWETDCSSRLCKPLVSPSEDVHQDPKTFVLLEGNTEVENNMVSYTFSVCEASRLLYFLAVCSRRERKWGPESEYYFSPTRLVSFNQDPIPDQGVCSALLFSTTSHHLPRFPEIELVSSAWLMVFLATKSSQKSLAWKQLWRVTRQARILPPL